MRRATTSILVGIAVVAVVAASCSSGRGTTDGTGPASTQGIAPAGSVSAGPSTMPSTSGTGVDTSVTDGPPGPHGPSLPGLLDTSDETVPNDPDVRTGVLDNGLTFYIRNNDNPGSKADLRLAVGAGSVDELGDTTGVAHFVEHMLFNGTETFPENELIDTLRSFGAAFGADVNAFTSYDETVYSLVVPNAPESLETGLNVLEQWLSHATFDDAQVVAERGVVLDEWRVRTQSTDGRLFSVAEQLFLTGTPYSGRAPIGTNNDIAAIGRDDVVAFYDAWYRPDNAAVIVVGDIDVDDVERDLHRLFDPAVGRTPEAPPVPDVSFAPFAGPGFALHSDPDQQTVDVEVTLPLPGGELGNGTASSRAQFTDRMISDILVRRLDQDVAAGTAPFDRITPGGNSFVETLDAPALYAFTDADGVGDTLDALLAEYERADRFGFTTAEADAARSSLQSFFDTRYDGRDSTQDSDYADQYVADYLTDGGFPSIDTEHDTATRLLTGITAEALDLRFAARWANSAPQVIISTPASQADRMPDRNQVLAAIAAAGSAPLDPRPTGRDLPDAIMERPAPVSPTAEFAVTEFGGAFFQPVELDYPNGVRVILNQNAIVEGQVYLQAGSPGGSSVVADDDVIDARYAADVVTNGGVDVYNQAELDQILAGSDVIIDAAISPYRETFTGSASTADIEVMFQLLNRYMTRPRFDQVALDQLRSSVRPVIVDPSSDPDTAALDALFELRYGDELRYTTLPTVEQFDTLDLDGIQRVWTSRYGNASDWVFVLSGDLDVDAVSQLADAYLGTLTGGTPDRIVDVEDPPPPGVVATTVRAGTGDTASLSMLFTSPVADIDQNTRAAADVVTEVLGERLTEVVRERNGDSYSPYAVSYVTTDPAPAIVTYVAVTGAPARIQAVADLVVAELADLGANGPTDREFSNATAQVQETYNFVDNGTFTTELLDDAIDPARRLEDYLFELDGLRSVTAAVVRTYVASNIDTSTYLRVDVVPR
ncbi:MAG: insulinase family protein [Ilumatobacteraceae bacterium]